MFLINKYSMMFGEVMGLNWGGLERRRQLAVGGGGSLVLDLVRGVGTLERSAGARVFCCLGVKRGFFVLILQNNSTLQIAQLIFRYFCWLLRQTFT